MLREAISTGMDPTAQTSPGTKGFPHPNFNTSDPLQEVARLNLVFVN